MWLRKQKQKKKETVPSSFQNCGSHVVSGFVGAEQNCGGWNECYAVLWKQEPRRWAELSWANLVMGAKETAANEAAPEHTGNRSSDDSREAGEKRLFLVQRGQWWESILCRWGCSGKGSNPCVQTGRQKRQSRSGEAEPRSHPLELSCKSGQVPRSARPLEPAPMHSF